MDPLALAAVVGLVFAGKTIADSTESTSTPSPQPTTKPPLTRRQIDLMAHPADHAADAFDLRNTTPQLGRRIGDWRIQPKEAVPNLQDITPTNSRFPYGQPVYDLYNREYVTNKQNNVSPLEQPKNIGPGLGVGPDVLAAGGFHDFFRALPTNVNEERLTTLEGRPGPRNPFVKNGGAAYIGDITHQAAGTKAAYRAPGAYGGGGAQSALVGPEGRPNYLKTKKMTIRSETGLRTDTLSDGPPQYNVAQPYAVGKSCYTDTDLTRSSGYRTKPDRAGNAARMNVRNDPVNQVGAMSQLRIEARPVPPGPMGLTGNNQGRGVLPPQFDDPLNEFKANPNPRAQTDFLDIAIQQLEKNPLAYSLAAPKKADPEMETRPFNTVSVN
jgi:Family of unknown function (DUF5899)